MPTFEVSCLDYLYDVTSGDLSLKVFVEEMKTIRVIMMNRSNFSNSNKNTTIDEEMNKTGRMFVGKKFKWGFEDDPNKKRLSPDEEVAVFEEFKKNIGQTMENTAEGMFNDDGQISRYVSKLVNPPEKHLDGLIKEQLDWANKKSEK